MSATEQIEEPTFGERLRAARAAKYGRARFALRIGVTKAAVQQWEKDSTLPGFERVPLIQDALELPPGTLDEWVRNSPKHRATVAALGEDTLEYVNRLMVALRDWTCALRFPVAPEPLTN